MSVKMTRGRIGAATVALALGGGLVVAPFATSADLSSSFGETTKEISFPRLLLPPLTRLT